MMYTFFNSHIKSICVLVLLLSMCALHLPELSSKSDYESFSNWVNTQVANDYSENSTDSLPNSRFLTNSDFIKHVKLMVGNEQLNENDPLDREVVRYLYLTWTKFFSTSDMARALNFERLKPICFVHHFTVPGFYTTSSSDLLRIQSCQLSRIENLDTVIYAYLTEPAISGMSIHAP